jgi:integrase
MRHLPNHEISCAEGASEMATKSKRPKPAHVADIRAKVVRGPDSDGRWYWRFWRTRNGVEENVAKAGWYTEVEVERTLAGLVTSGPDSPRSRNRVNTVQDLLEFWIGELETRPDLAKRTLEIRRAAARHLRDAMGGVVLDSVDRLTIERYRDRRLRERVTVRRRPRPPEGSPPPGPEEWENVDAGRTAAPRSVAFEITVLRMAWRWGREVGVAPVRELPRVPVRIKGHTRDRYTPSTMDVARVLRALDGWARLALHLYAGTGCRLDEIAALCWGDVDLDHQHLTVTGKTGTRRVPLSPPLVQALRAAGPGAAEARVLTCAVSTARAIYDRLKVACKAAEVPYFAPGGLRRAAVIALYRSGMDPSVSGAIIGHSPAVAMRHYRQVAGDEAREAVLLARLGYLPDPDSNVVELPRTARKP